MNTEADGASRRVQSLLLVTMAVWGLNLSAVKALTAVIDVMWVAAGRMVVAVVALTAMLALGKAPLMRIPGSKLLALAGCAVLMVYGNQVLFATALSRTSATNAALILALSPLVSTLMTAVLLGERLSSRRILGIALGFAGVAAVVLHRPGAGVSGVNSGDLLFLASVVSFSAGGIAVQRLSPGMRALELSWIVHVFGAAMLLVHALVFDAAELHALVNAGWRSWALIVFSGVFATALAAVIWNHAISRVGAARTSMAVYWVPIFGVGFAAAFLGEPLTLWHAIGLVNVIGGSLLATRR